MNNPYLLLQIALACPVRADAWAWVVANPKLARYKGAWVMLYERFGSHDIIHESRRGCSKEVRWLLEVPSRCNPSARDNWAVQLASFNGHIDVVRL